MVNKKQLLKPLILLVFLLFPVFALSGCAASGFSIINTQEGEVAVPNCYPLIKYSGTSVSVEGVTLVIPNVPVKIGGVTVKPITIQQASETVQILDNYRMIACQLLPSYATVSKDEFLKELYKMQKEEEILTEFALVVSSKNGMAIQQFVKLYFPQIGSVAKINKGMGITEFKSLKGLTVFPLNELFIKK